MNFKILKHNFDKNFVSGIRSILYLCHNVQRAESERSKCEFLVSSKTNNQRKLITRHCLSN